MQMKMRHALTRYCSGGVHDIHSIRPFFKNFSCYFLGRQNGRRNGAFVDISDIIEMIFRNN